MRRRLSYYVDEFPLPQGASAGPYRSFVGTPIAQLGAARHAHVPCVIMHSPNLPSRQRHGMPSNVVPPKRHSRRARRLHGLGYLGQSSDLPSGSSLVYSCTWTETGLIGPSSSSVIANITPLLAAQNIAVDSSTPIGALSFGNGFTMSVHTTADFGQAADVKSIIDGLVYQMIASSTGKMPQSSITTAALAMAQPATPTVASASPDQLNQYAENYNAAIAAGDSSSAAYWLSLINASSGNPSTDALTWIENNPLWAAGGILALALLWRMA
jgi:hypothetical protein